jgi:hypothetical protein
LFLKGPDKLGWTTSANDLLHFSVTVNPNSLGGGLPKHLFNQLAVPKILL